jgi:hypothetical protein
MHTRPYEILVRFAADGSVAGISAKTLTTVDGRAYESDPMPIESTDDPAFSEFAQLFAAAAVTERDELAAQVSELLAQISTLQSQIPAPRGPREVTPEQFLARFSPADIVAIDQSTDPRVVLAKVTLQTRSSVIDLDSPLLAAMIDGLIEAGIAIDQTERERIFA